MSEERVKAAGELSAVDLGTRVRLARPVFDGRAGDRPDIDVAAEGVEGLLRSIRKVRLLRSEVYERAVVLEVERDAGEVTDVGPLYLEHIVEVNVGSSSE